MVIISFYYEIFYLFLYITIPAMRVSVMMITPSKDGVKNRWARIGISIKSSIKSVSMNALPTVCMSTAGQTDWVRIRISP